MGHNKEETKGCHLQSDSMGDFARAMNSFSASCNCESHHQNKDRQRLKINEDNIKNGLAQLVMTLIKLLHELLERQAIRRIESESLDDEQTERLGLTLMRQSREIEKLCHAFNLEEKDLNLDLGPLGRLF